MAVQNFMRKKKITIGAFTFKGEDLEIRFSIKFDHDYKPNSQRVDIYNLSNKTLATIKKGDQVIIQAGYGSDIGVIASGKLDRFVTKRDGVDRITSFFVLEGDDYTRVRLVPKFADKDSIKKFTKGINKGDIMMDALKLSLAKGSKASTGIKRLVEAMGMKLGAPIVLKKDYVYKKGFVASKILINDLEQMVKDCGSVLYHRRGKLIIRPLDQGIDEKFTLNVNTGLLKVEQFNEDGYEGYKIRCFLQHRITTASIITLDSKLVKGKFRAIEGEFVADADDFYLEFKVV